MVARSEENDVTCIIKVLQHVLVCYKSVSYTAPWPVHETVALNEPVSEAETPANLRQGFRVGQVVFPAPKFEE